MENQIQVKEKIFKLNSLLQDEEIFKWMMVSKIQDGNDDKLSDNVQQKSI